MQTPTGSWMRAIQKKDKLNILTSPTHERFESHLTKTDHNFYSLNHPELKDWNHGSAKKPDNYYIYNLDKLPNNIDFDLVLSQSRFGQFQFLAPIAQKMGLPLIQLEHTATMPFWAPRMKEGLSQMRGDLNLFISEWQIEDWSLGDANNKVINHCVDTDLFKSEDVERTDHIFSVVNDWIHRGPILGFEIWRRMTHGLPVHVRGDTAGLSTSCDTVEQLAEEYNKSSIFLNTSEYSPIPMSLLEAMSCGCAVVSMKTCGIPEFIDHGVNGFISEDPQELREYCEMLLNDPKLARQVGDAARKTILDKCSLERFVNEYNTAFYDTILK